MEHGQDDGHMLLRLMQQKFDEKFPSHLQVYLSSIVLFADERASSNCIIELRKQSFVIATISEIFEELYFYEQMQLKDRQSFADYRKSLRSVILIHPRQYNLTQSYSYQRIKNIFPTVHPVTDIDFFQTYIPKYRDNDEVMYCIWTVIERMDSNLIRDSIIRALELDKGRIPALNKSDQDAIIKNFVISFYDANHAFYMGFTEKLDPQEEIFLYNVVPSSFDFRIAAQRKYGTYLDRFNMQQHLTLRASEYTSDNGEKSHQDDECLPFYSPIQLLPRQCDDPTNPHFYINDCKYGYIYAHNPGNYPFPRLLINTFNLLKGNESIQKTEKDLTKTVVKLANYQRIWEQYYYIATHALVKMVYINLDDAERIIDNIQQQISLMRSKRHKPTIDITQTDFLYSSFVDRPDIPRIYALRQHRFPTLPIRAMVCKSHVSAKLYFKAFVTETLQIYYSSIGTVLYNSLQQRLGVELKQQEFDYLKATFNVDEDLITDLLYQFCEDYMQTAYADFRFVMDMDEMEVIMACNIRSCLFKLLVSGFFNRDLQYNFEDMHQIRFFQDYSSIIRKYQMKRKNVRDYQVDLSMKTSRLSAKVLWLIIRTLNDCIIVHFNQPELMESAYKILKNSRHYTSFACIQYLAQYVHVGRRQKQFTQPITAKNEQEYSFYYFKEGKQASFETNATLIGESPNGGKCNICKFGVDYYFPNYKEHVRSYEHIENYKKELGAEVEKLKRYASIDKQQTLTEELTALCAIVARANNVDYADFTGYFNILLRNIGLSVVVDAQDGIVDDRAVQSDEFRNWYQQITFERFDHFEDNLQDTSDHNFESGIIACAYMMYKSNYCSRDMKITLQRVIEQYGGEQGRALMENEPQVVSLNEVQGSRFTGVSDVVDQELLYANYEQIERLVEEAADEFTTMASVPAKECETMQECMRFQLDLTLSPVQEYQFEDQLLAFLAKKLDGETKPNKEMTMKAEIMEIRLYAKMAIDEYEINGAAFKTKFRPLDTTKPLKKKNLLPAGAQGHYYSHSLSIPPLFVKNSTTVEQYARYFEGMKLYYRSLEEKLTVENISLYGLLFSFFKQIDLMENIAAHNPIVRDEQSFINQLTENTSARAVEYQRTFDSDADSAYSYVEVDFRDDTELDLFYESTSIFPEPLVLSENFTIMKSSSDMQTHRQSSMESTDLRVYERQMLSRQKICNRIMTKYKIQNTRLCYRLSTMPYLCISNEFPQHSLYEFSAIIAYSYLKRVKIPESQLSKQPSRGFDYYQDSISLETVNMQIVNSISSLLLAQTSPSVISGTAQFVTDSALTSISLGAYNACFSDWYVIDAAANCRANDESNFREIFVNGRTCNRRVASTGAW